MRDEFSKKFILAIFELSFVIVLPNISNAMPISWVDRTSADSVSATGSVSGITVDFSGVISSISWTVPVAESWHGFTLGIAGVGEPVPEPSTLLLLGAGISGIILAKRKKMK